MHVQGLRALVVRVDEVAFEMRGEHARGARDGVALGAADVLQHQRQGARGRRRCWWGGAEAGDAVARQSAGHRVDALLAGQCVVAFEAVDMDVDEAGDDDVAGHVDMRLTVGRRPRAGDDVDDQALLDDDGARTDHAIRQHHGRAGEDGPAPRGSGHGGRQQRGCVHGQSE